MRYPPGGGIPYTQTTDLEAVMPELDILYMTRVQRERFFKVQDGVDLDDVLLPQLPAGHVLQDGHRAVQLSQAI